MSLASIDAGSNSVNRTVFSEVKSTLKFKQQRYNRVLNANHTQKELSLARVPQKEY